jgi:hypothetical protein
MRDNGGFQNWQFVVVRTYKNIETKEQLLKKERKYMERLKATLNKQVPSRTYKESYKAHYEKNKDVINEKSKAKYQLNKEAINAWHKEHYQKTKHIRNAKLECECGCMISKYHMKRHISSDKHKQLMGEI